MNTRILDGEIIATRLDDVRAYDGVRSRRIFAFLIDYLIVGLLLIPFGILVALLGLLTFGLGWSLFARSRPGGGADLCLEHAWRAEPGDGRHADDGHPARPPGRPAGRRHAGGGAHGAVLGRQRGADAVHPAGLAVCRPQAHACTTCCSAPWSPGPTAERRTRRVATLRRSANREPTIQLNFSRHAPR